MIQAKYDQTPPAGFDITLENQGMAQGALAKYWLETKRYPNGYWADFTLTPDGKKAVKLLKGGDIIEWRPDSPADPHFAVVVESLAPTHLKATNLGDVQTVGDTRVVQYTEAVDLSSLPQPLQGVAADTRQHPHHVAPSHICSYEWSLDPAIDRVSIVKAHRRMEPRTSGSIHFFMLWARRKIRPDKNSLSGHWMLPRIRLIRTKAARPLG